jgi:tetratricopeptide (TPR) repeat protein
MRAFLSHSTANKAIVVAVHDALERDATWLDRAEIEWGDLFLEKIAAGIRSATDFVLFWSAPAAKSEWVRLEINMAFIQALRQKAIRLRVILLDNTPLPLYLQPFQAFSVAGSSDPTRDILEKLSPLLREHTRSARASFVNRHAEIASMEDSVDDPEAFAVWLFGFTGVGKSSLVHEALRRIFAGADSVKIEVNEGTGFVELALALNASVRNETLAESLPYQEIEHQIRLSIEILARDERLLVVTNVQHWLNEDGEPRGPLPLLLDIVKGLPAFASRPVFLTSTRRPNLDPVGLTRLALKRIQGLDDEHIGVLVRNWYFSIHGRELPPEDAKRIAPKLFGHPVAARLVAGLLGDHSVDYLDQYPRELISLRRDLARILLQDMKLGPPAERLMETLAMVGIGLSGSTIAACGFSDDEFQLAVDQCARAGLITANTKIEGHPLFRDFFWHRLHRSDYQQRARQLADILKNQLTAMNKDSLAEYAELLPVAYRLFLLADDYAAANELRRDLSGELEAAAITLYNRRNYVLADRYIDHVLDGDPKNWRMRLYRVRVRIRQEDWAGADTIIFEMLKERPGDIGALHAKGWRFLRQGRLQDALDIFSGIISRREHVASLRDAAECLHRMGNNLEALEFLKRAKARESENPFVLDLESRILEDMGQLGPAYESALLASARDPLNGHLHHRLGQIRNKQGRPDYSIPHFQKAIELDSDQFSPANSLASAYLDIGDAPASESMVAGLVAKARTPADRALVEHTKARIAFAKNDLLGSEKILKLEIINSRNLVPNFGLLVRVELALFDKNIGQFPTIADVALNSAEQALTSIVNLDPSNKFIESLRASVVDRRRLRAT